MISAWVYWLVIAVACGLAYFDVPATYPWVESATAFIGGLALARLLHAGWRRAQSRRRSR